MSMQEKKYLTNGGVEITLTQAVVEQIAGAKVTEKEYNEFVSLCEARKLNPFTNEVYFIKYGNAKAQIVVSKDAFFMRADAHPDFDGLESGIIVEHDGTYERLVGNFTPSNSKLVGGWARCHRKSQKFPREVSVNFDEYCKKSNGKATGTWSSMPGIMIEKVAKVMALREGFPSDFSGMYVSEEFNGRDENPVVVNNDTGEVVAPTQPTPMVKKELDETSVLGYKFESGPEKDGQTPLKGKEILTMVMNTKDKAAFLEWMNVGKTTGTENDKKACELLLKLIDDGKVDFPNAKEAA